MQLTNLLTVATLASLAVASPVTTAAKKPQNNFAITNFVFGCTVTCDWSFDVVNTNEQLPGHPAVTKPVHCKGSKGTNKAFDPSTCGFISKTQQFAAYISDDNQLNLQYKVNVPSKKKGEPGATYWYEGAKEVGAATGYNPSPPSFKVPETKAYAIA